MSEYEQAVNNDSYKNSNNKNEIEKRNNTHRLGRQPRVQEDGVLQQGDAEAEALA
jgi:hypothetical protein